MLDGRWVLIDGERAGKPLPQEGFLGAEITFLDGVYTFLDDRGDYTLIENEEDGLGALDIVGRHGPNKGRTMLAICRREGDMLRICYDLSGRTRPSSFDTAGDADRFLAIWRRKA